MRQTATRKDRVDLGNPERQTARLLRALALDGGDAFTQISKDSIADSRHRSRNPSGLRWLGITTSCRLECLMFLFCSFMEAVSSRSETENLGVI